ncbi:MAG: DUF3102 domain-containing protein [Thiothrix sp.]|nr:DUF3102 domain-containing protein [Thiothrix sp.]
MKDGNDSHTLDLVARQELQQVVATYGDGLPYSYERVLNECAFFIEASAKAAIELGRRLILIKEMEGHGRFGVALEELGLSRFTASKMMNAVLKMPSNVSTSTHLLQQVKTKSKLLELMALDDVDIEALGEGQTVAGLTLDDVDRMSVRELRAALRASRDDLKAKDAVLSNKNRKLDEMEGKLDNLSRKLVEQGRRKELEEPDPDHEGQELRVGIAGLVASIETDRITRQLAGAFAELVAHGERNGVDHTPFMAGCINQIMHAARLLQSDYGLWLDDDSTQSPYWETQQGQQEADEAIAKLNVDWGKFEDGQTHN